MHAQPSVTWGNRVQPEPRGRAVGSFGRGAKREAAHTSLPCLLGGKATGSASLTSQHSGLTADHSSYCSPSILSAAPRGPRAGNFHGHHRRQTTEVGEHRLLYIKIFHATTMRPMHEHEPVPPLNEGQAFIKHLDLPLVRLEQTGPRPTA